MIAAADLFSFTAGTIVGAAAISVLWMLLRP